EVRCETTRWKPPAASSSSSRAGRRGYFGRMSDPVLLPRLLPSAISHHVGDRTASRGLGLARAGRVGGLAWEAPAQTVAATVTDEDGSLQHPQVMLTEYDEDSVSRRFQSPG